MNNNRGPEITDSMTGFRTREIELLVSGATKNSIVVANRLWGEGKGERPATSFRTDFAWSGRAIGTHVTVKPLWGFNKKVNIS